jgi:hypothetical protein
MPGKANHINLAGQMPRNFRLLVHPASYRHTREQRTAFHSPRKWPGSQMLQRGVLFPTTADRSSYYTL